MAHFTEARYGIVWNYVSGESGWGSSFNLAVRTLGAMLNCFLLSDTTNSPPSSPADGDAYFVPVGGGTGAWLTAGGKIAAYQGGSWAFYAPPKGLRAYILDRTSFYWWSGSGWTQEVTSVSTFAPLDSPTFTGTPTVPDVDISDNSEKISNTKHVHDKFAAFADDVFSSGSEGDIVVRGASAWARLAAGTSGQILYTAGTSGIPYWDDAPTGGGGGGGGGGGDLPVYTAAAVTSGSAIDVQITAGASSVSNARAGDINLQGGATTGSGSVSNGTARLLGGPASSYASGGSAVVQGGSSSANNTRGGNTYVRGGDAGHDGVGGSVFVSSGTDTGAGSGNSGSIYITVPAAYGSQIGGGTDYACIIVRAGDTGDGNSAGHLLLGAGNGTGGGGFGGNVNVTAGNGGTFRAGGGLNFTAGNAGSGAGHGGDIVLTPGSSSTDRAGLVFIANLPTSDPHAAHALWNNGGVLSVSAG